MKGHRNRPLPGFDEHVFAKSSAPCGPFHENRASSMPNRFVTPSIRRGISRAAVPPVPVPADMLIGFAQSQWCLRSR